MGSPRQDSPTPGSNQKYLRIAHEGGIDNVALPFWRKLFFAIGGAPYQITCTVIGFFLNIFLLEVALLQPRYVSVILFSGHAWDAVTDPAIGILVQKTDTRWGKMRPWIIFSAPFACLTYFFLFFVPWDPTVDDEGLEKYTSNEVVRFVYYLLIFCAFQGFLSCLHVPYTSLTMAVTSKQKERDQITFMRMGLETTGVLLAVFIQGLFVSDTRCDGNEELPKNATTIEAQKDAYFHGSLVVIIIYMLCCIITFIGTREKKGIVEVKKEDQKGFFSGIKLVFKFKPYVWASLTFLFMTIAIQIAQTNVALFCTHTLKEGGELTKFILVLLVCAIASMPLWQFLIVKFGKKTAYALGMGVMIPTFITQLFVPAHSVALYYVIMVFGGLGISVAFLLPWSVLPDVLDLYMLEKNKRHDALFYSFYVFFNKLASGTALAASQIALEFGGYINGKCKQPDSVGYTLRILMTPGPVILVLLALGCLYMYPIDERMRRSIKERVQDHTVKLSQREEVLDGQVSKSYDSFTASLDGRPSSDTEI
ncbi:sodium-dependent lysophosphatidylcholine symporter 1-like [Plakobranchus ocellatus]|uniref:Sodium-dependent lysophosphatidylcholine symporter 1-like n=1 Tax=Plakobranchus ocellatus TaxID=259542 RepID=A0AAV4BKH7_9GAST|nr:sodium-dependent lysophosphatidylcholine symporter 1-like [Plakobranchus ocellatus]